MNEEQSNTEIKEDNYINNTLIKSALQKIKKENSKKNNTNNNQISDSDINSNQLIIKDIENLINSIKLMEKFFNYINKSKKQLNLSLERKINYIYKLASKGTNGIFTKIKKDSNESLLALFITLLKNYINEKNHEKIRKLLIMIIRLITEDIILANSLKIIVEIFINIMIIILNANQDKKYSINDEPFFFISDIIDSLILFPKEIKIDKIDNCVLSHIIDIFDKYLITPDYTNICFRGLPIWLKILENNMINPLIEEKIEKNKNKEYEKKNDDEENPMQVSNDNNDNEEKNIQQKIYDFLIKIYKFNMIDEYLQNIIIPK